MGFTAAAALNRLPTESEIVVAEIVPAVVSWNRGPLADLAGRPLEDSRLVVREVDIARILQDEKKAYDAVLLDVDNGPDGLTRQGNSWLYSGSGLKAAFEALLPAGILAVWSAGPDPSFTQRLKKAGFKVTEKRVRARAGNKGSHHTIWLGIRGC
jgi:spermidine synthase